MKIYTKLGSILTILLVGTIFARYVTGVLAAQGASVTVSPSSASVTQNGLVTFTVVGNTGDGDAQGAEVALNYDVSKLEYQSYSVSGSPFAVAGSSALFNDGAGSFQGFISTNSTALRGTNLLIVKVVFKAKVAAGSTQLQLVNGSSSYTDLYKDGNSLTATKGSASVSFVSASCPSGQVGTPPNCTTPASTGSGGGTVTTTPTPSTSPSTPSSTTTPSKSVVTLVPPTSSAMNLGAGTSQTKAATPATDASGGSSPASIVATPDIQTSGVASNVIPRFAINIYDQDHQPLRHKSVTLHSDPQTVETNDAGLATFTNVAPGNHTISYTQGEKDYSQALTLVQDTVGAATDGVALQTNPTAVVFPFQQPKGLSMTLIAAVFAALVVPLLLLAAFLYARKTGLLTRFKRQQVAYQPVVAQTSSSVADTENDSMTSLMNTIESPRQPSPGQTVLPTQPQSPPEDVQNDKL